MSGLGYASVGMARAWSRRAVLRASGAPAVAALAGCGFGGRRAARSSVTAAPVPTDPPTPTAEPVPTLLTRPTRLAFDATVRQQPSADAPPQVRVTLTNEGPGTPIVHVGAGLLWSVGAEYPSAIVVLPVDYRPPGVPATPTAGCWQFAAESRPAVPAIAQYGPVPPGERLATTFAVYGDPATEPCYPAGEYLIRDAVEFGEDGGASRELAVTVTIDEAGAFSAATRPREFNV